ncbi:LysR family transcriptional regulator [Photobacterium damselae]|uniref:LysR family transcriptional regulator n=1 Tax=Photobacterium damselae TaxID=38293 RepID=UPI0011106001|nr:LysR family transcriptional regulator [Photobacterium damselae]
MGATTQIAYGVFVDISLSRYLPAFISAAETLNFSIAARQLEVTPASVSKSIKNLEQSLHMRLFHRSTHSLTLTSEGEAFYHSIRPIVSQLSNVISDSQFKDQIPAGILRISIPYGFGVRYFLPHISGFCREYPEVELDLRFEDRAVDLVDERIDLAVGNSIKQDSRIIARQLCPLEYTIVASPRYLEENGVPQHPSQLKQHSALCFRSPTSGRVNAWQFQESDGTQFSIDMNAKVTLTNMELIPKLALEGLGIAIVGEWMVREEIEKGKLVEVLKPFVTNGPPLMIYYLSREQLPKKTRVFIDYMLENINF